jgi:hypothetical protein
MRCSGRTVLLRSAPPAPVLMAGPTGTITYAAPTGTITTTGGVAAFRASAPQSDQQARLARRRSGRIVINRTALPGPVTLSGPVGTVTYAAPTGTLSVTVLGPVAAVTYAAPAGSVLIGLAVLRPSVTIVAPTAATASRRLSVLRASGRALVARTTIPTFVPAPLVAVVSRRRRGPLTAQVLRGPVNPAVLAPPTNISLTSTPGAVAYAAPAGTVTGSGQPPPNITTPGPIVSIAAVLTARRLFHPGPYPDASRTWATPPILSGVLTISVRQVSRRPPRRQVRPAIVLRNRLPDPVVTLPGPTATVTYAAPVGSVSVSVTTPTGTVTYSAPAGVVSTGADVAISGPTGTITYLAPPGRVDVGTSAPAGTVTYVAPIGRVDVTVPGPTAGVTWAAPAGTVTGAGTSGFVGWGIPI